MTSLKALTVLGNIFFIAWIWWNGIDEGFKASRLQLASYLFLTALLIFNIYLLSRKK